MSITFNTSAKPGETAYKDILFEVKDQVAWITINRPRVRNAFREQTLDEMIHAFSSTRLDPMIACAVVTGAGDEAFSAGGDFHAMMKLNRANAHMWNDRMLGLAMTIRGLPIPVIAMVNGWCMGGGHELALWCDLVIASENAVFGQTGAKVAACPTVGATQYLPRIIGERLAREMIFMARTFPAAEAVQVGLINRCVPKADLLQGDARLVREGQGSQRRRRCAPPRSRSTTSRTSSTPPGSTAWSCSPISGARRRASRACRPSSTAASPTSTSSASATRKRSTAITTTAPATATRRRGRRPSSAGRSDAMTEP